MVCFKRIIFKVNRKAIDSMSSKNRSDENLIFVEYCRSCQTHSWCTHHDEAKYHETFLKLSEMMAHRMPQVEVIGNMVPPNLIPFKIAQNKYIDANTNKYVVYPQIGSFEVTFRGRVIFSKKETHTWPNLPSIVSKISTIVNPDYQSPAKDAGRMEEDRETSKVSNNNSFLDSEEDRKTNYKTQQKGFTLTDHFKMYRPKNTFEEKDWLTEKQESQASLRQISEMGRLQSREKSEKKSERSVDSKKSSDIVGQTKLKEMLKHKSMINKESGKKQMIIRLDSIEEENIFEEAAAVTQRTQQKNVKKNNRMKQIDDQINQLDTKFKNFENRVHDIQTRNKQFEMKPGNLNAGDEKSRFKQIIQGKQQEMQRKASLKNQRQSEMKERQAREKAFADKTNKLEQYLNYTQQQKNDKLHRIYGEWKLIKQFNNRNKKLLKGKSKATQQQQLQDSESESASKTYSRSQSPNSFGNIITFKHKNQKNLQRKLKNQKNQKQHKYSSVQRYQNISSQLFKDARNQTDQHFYNNRKFLKPKAQLQSETEINHSHHPISKLIKKSVNTLSMNALKSLTNNQSNLPKIQSDSNSVQNFSASAKANISKISSRISNIQQKLKNHNSNSGFEPILESPYADRSRNYSKKSQSRSGSEHNSSMKKLNKIYNGANNERKSNASGNTVKKNYSQDRLKNANFSQVDRPQTKKINEKSMIKQEQEYQYKPHQSGRKQVRYVEETEEDAIVYSKNSPNKTSKNSNSPLKNSINGSSRKVSNSKEPQIRNSKDTQGRRQKQSNNLKQLKQKTLKEKSSTQQLSQNQQNTDSKRAFRERKVQGRQIKRQDRRKQAEIDEFEEQQQSQNHNEHQYEYHPHQARKPKPLQRKFKEWRQSSPTTNVFKSKEIVKPQGINKKIRESDSKQTVIRSKKLKKNQIDQNKQVASSNQEELQNNSEAVPAEEKKVRSGQIKRNRPPKQSVHKDSKQKVNQQPQKKSQIKRGQIRNQYEYNVAPSQRSQENQDVENGEQSSNYESQQNRKHSNRFSSENEYQSLNNYERCENSSKVTAVNDQKLRKTLGYFKVNELCYRGVKTSQENRQGDVRVKKVHQASLYETQQNNHQSQQQEVQQDNQQQVQQEDASNHEQNQENQSRTSESEFVPECKKKCETLQKQKEGSEQGWKGKSQDIYNEDEMLPQEIQQMSSEKKVRKNSLQQKMEKQQRVDDQQQEANEEDEVHEVKSQQVINEKEYSKQEVMRPQTTQEVCNFSQEKVKEEDIQQQANEVQQAHANLPKQKQEQNILSKDEANVASSPSSVAKRLSSESKTKKQSKNKVPEDLDLIVSKEYSEYLSCKISNQLSKVQAKANAISQNKQKTEEKVANSVEQTQQANKLQGEIESKHEEYPEIANFIQFQPQRPVVLQQYIEQNQEYQNKVEETQPLSEKLSENNIQQQQTAKIEKQDTKIDTKNDEKCQKQKQNITLPIVNGVSNNVSIPNSNQNAQKSHLINQAILKVSASEPNHTSSSQNKVSKSNSLQDNVYSEPQVKNLRKFTQIGVQKQLTLEVSIQTDSPQFNDNVMLSRNANFAVAEEQEKKSLRQGTPRQQENALSQFDATVRNNYLNETKSSFHPNRSPREPIRAKITNQILSLTRQKQMQKFTRVMLGNDDQILKEQGAVTKISSVYPQGMFMSERSLEVEQIKTKFPNFLKVLQILAERGEWILTRLFEDPKGLLQERAFGVWLCINFQWECFIVDDCIKVDESSLPLFTYHSGNQKWSNILQKAIAAALGGYQQLARADCTEIFTLLTGCNAIGVKVKQDPSKNGKMLQLINECQRKNYIVHAEKHYERNKQQRDSIYYVLSVRRSNSEEEALLEISQDGRQSFWMRLSKFTQQFSRVQILQLRVNHNFTHIDLGIAKENQLTVIQLAFGESGQGCVTLSYIGHAGPLTAYLYREERSRVLKLVGQARQKQKSHLFFQCNFNEGRYYVFAQTKEKPARLAYYGENGPSLKITEEIHNDGLKNEVAEYLPIRQTKQKPRRQMEQTWSDWKGKAPRLRDNFMQSRLRQNFVEYILGQTRRREKEGNEL